MLLKNVTDYFDGYLNRIDYYRFTPNSKFWELWENNKEALKQEGITVKKREVKKYRKCMYYVMIQKNEEDLKDQENI